jgi:hypothetical protein
MTGNDFRAWRLRTGLTAPAAATALGVSRRTIFNLQVRPQIPGPICIATVAVEDQINREKEAA